jgi:hypothetical protein
MKRITLMTLVATTLLGVHAHASEPTIKALLDHFSAHEMPLQVTSYESPMRGDETVEAVAIISHEEKNEKGVTVHHLGTITRFKDSQVALAKKKQFTKFMKVSIPVNGAFMLLLGEHSESKRGKAIIKLFESFKHLPRDK